MGMAQPESRPAPAESPRLGPKCLKGTGRWYFLRGMKAPFFCLIAVGLTATLHAELKIPRSVYQIDQLEEAQAEAAEENKGLAFVMTDPGST